MRDRLAPAKSTVRSTSFFLFLSLLAPAVAFAQPVDPVPTPVPAAAATPSAGPASLERLDDLSLEELLSVPIAVAAKIPRPTRESPAVLTLLTRDRIAASGARDLTDVLQMVPGFSFGVDLKGVVGVGFRGNWAHEGKVLLLVDGQEINELLYYNLPLGGHLPIDQIERIEIVRGPGSVIYGGSAELAVINVTTRGAAELDGSQATVRYGQGKNGMMRRTAGLAWGKTFGSGLELTASGHVGNGNRSDDVYRDFSGGTVSMGGASHLDNYYLNLGLKKGGLGARFLFDDYRIQSLDGYDVVFPGPVPNEFLSYFGDIHYEKAIGSKVTITPRLTYKRQSTWRTVVSRETSEDYAAYFDPVTSRTTAEVLAAVEVQRGLSLLSGASYNHDEYWVATSLSTPDQEGWDRVFGGPGKATYGNLALFSQVLFDNKIANVAAGARVEYHSKFGVSFVPRFALTKVMGRFHAKAMFSQAFRAPSVDNIDYNPDLKPERTTALEAELGMRPTARTYVAVNVFDLTIDDTIVYDVNETTGEDNYFNFGKSGSRGAELDFQASLPHGSLSASWAYYNAAGKNEVVPYAVPRHREFMLAAPMHKGTVGASVRLNDTLSVGGTAVYLGTRYGFLVGDTSAAVGELDKEDPIVLANAFVNYRVPYHGMEIGGGVYNVFGEKYDYIQPYDGDHAPLPAEPREVAVRVSMKF